MHAQAKTIGIAVKMEDVCSDPYTLSIEGSLHS